MDSDTIAAIATAAGGGIGIVRISGPSALTVGARIFRGGGGRRLEETPPMTLLLGAVVEPVSGDEIDAAFAVHMRAGRSYTGESTVEVHCHGGRGVLDAVLTATLRAGARLAEPGEFTKRAFLGGRLDLSQAEAVAELVAAQTEAARRSALARLQGSLGDRVRAMRGRLLDQLAVAEAVLDHGDEETDRISPNVEEIAALGREVQDLVDLGEAREAREGGPRVVIAGRTNAGKSSIFNMLCNIDRSLVSPIPGTTRDYVEERFCFGGTLVTLVDTAGLREVPDEIESEGIRRSRLQMRGADLLIIVIDGSLPLGAGDLQLIDEFGDRSPLVVLSKSDLPEGVDPARLGAIYPSLRILPVSALAGLGCADLLQAVAHRCRAGQDGDPTSPNRRHREALRRAAAALEEAGRILASGAMSLDLAAAELRLALSALGEVTGETTSEEVVDRIFSRFCLGK